MMREADDADADRESRGVREADVLARVHGARTAAAAVAWGVVEPERSES